MRTPDFWHQDGLVALALAPLGWAYATASALRIKGPPTWSAPVPVVCIGNLVTGGAGKTPVALDIGRRLITQGFSPQFLSRGYGGQLAGPIAVDPLRHTARDVGDEPLLLAELAQCWVARDRCAGARAAVSAEADAIVMDDGFQNPSLAKDLSIVVIDGAYGFGNGRIFPAGPLRETVRSGLARADAVVLLGEDRTRVAEDLPASIPVLRGRLVPAPGSETIAGNRVVAFAGIGRPDKFFATLSEMGCSLLATHAFADHHPYAQHEIMSIVEQAASVDAMAVTTAKDFVRLPADAHTMVSVLHVVIEWENEESVTELLRPFTAAPETSARA